VPCEIVYFNVNILFFKHNNFELKLNNLLDICWWKNFENQSAFVEGAMKHPVSWFICSVLMLLTVELEPLCIVLSERVVCWQWATICLSLPHSTLKTVITGLLAELKRLQLKVPALPVASAISDRLCCLINNGGTQTELGASVVERALMYSELARRDTFTKWPHGNYK